MPWDKKVVIIELRAASPGRAGAGRGVCVAGAGRGVCVAGAGRKTGGQKKIRRRGAADFVRSGMF